MLPWELLTVGEVETLALPREEPSCAVKAGGREQVGGADGQGRSGSGWELGLPAGTAQGAVAGYGGCMSHGTQLDDVRGRTTKVVFSLEPLRWLQPQLQVATAEY